MAAEGQQAAVALLASLPRRGPTSKWPQGGQPRVLRCTLSAMNTRSKCAEPGLGSG